MKASNAVAWFGLAIGFSILAGCASGGGSSGGSTQNSGSSGTSAVSISADGAVSPTAVYPPLQASSTTLSIPAAIPAGTVFPLTNAELSLTAKDVEAVSPRSLVSLAYMGTQTVNGSTVYTFQVRDGSQLNFTTLPADGTAVTLSDGSRATLGLASLNYTFAGVWSRAGGGQSYIGTFVGGYQTPTANVPASGTGTYIGSGANVGSSTAGGVGGAVYVPDGNGSFVAAALVGQTNVTVNFSTGNVNGTLSGMSATPTSGGGATPWNDVSLTGTISGSHAPDAGGAAMTGTTSTSGAPAGAGTFGLSSAATGRFVGALYGNNGSELGAVWSLSEPNATNGKAAVGIISATKQ